MALIDELPEDAGPLIDIIERIMTHHWGMAACYCWVCAEGRELGCHPRDKFLHEDRPLVPVPKWVERL